MSGKAHSPTGSDKKEEKYSPKKLQPVPECDSAEFTQTTIDLNDRTTNAELAEVSKN